MADESTRRRTKNKDVDIEALREVLANAKIHVDAVVQGLRGDEGSISSLIQSRLRALEDNNSSCNTACSCGGGGGGSGGGGQCVAINPR